jgi:hypothetical protein
MKTLCYLPHLLAIAINDLSVVVRAAGCEFINCRTEAELYQHASTIHPNSRLALVTSQQDVALARQFNQRYPDHPILILIQSPLPQQSREIRECPGVHSFVAYNNSEIDPNDLTVTLRKIQTKSIFGVQRYLRYDCQTTKLEIASPEDKTYALQHIEAFVRYLGGDSPSSRFALYASRVSEMLDELVLNAVSHTCNRPLHEVAGFNFALPPSSAIQVEWGFDGEIFGVAVRDCAGTLRKEDVLTYLDSALVLSANNEEHMSHLAFKTIFERVHKFIVNVHPGFVSEVVAVMRFDRRLRDFDGRLRSFHFFTI